jgi:hypothetical protein
MAHTDVHRPWLVQAADPENRHRLRRFQTWPHQQPELVPTYNICGCPLCTSHHECRAERRRSRHEARQQLQQRRWE